MTNECKTECLWVLDGEGAATIKVDGTNVKIKNGQLLKRQKPKERDYDEASYVSCLREDPSDKWAFEAFDALEQKQDAVYELVGPKIQRNPQHEPAHRLIRVVPMNEQELEIPNDHLERSFGLRDFLVAHYYEGVVFHHPDGRLAKIKRRDFGLSWPVLSSVLRKEKP